MELPTQNTRWSTIPLTKRNMEVLKMYEKSIKTPLTSFSKDLTCTLSCSTIVLSKTVKTYLGNEGETEYDKDFKKLEEGDEIKVDSRCLEPWPRDTLQYEGNFYMGVDNHLVESKGNDIVFKKNALLKEYLKEKIELKFVDSSDGKKYFISATPFTEIEMLSSYVSTVSKVSKTKANSFNNAFEGFGSVVLCNKTLSENPLTFKFEKSNRPSFDELIKKLPIKATNEEVVETNIVASQALSIPTQRNEGSVIFVNCDVGEDAIVGLRGEKEGLSWGQNTMLTQISQSLWALPTNIDLSKVEGKFVRVPNQGEITWENIPNGKNRKFSSAAIQTCTPEIDGCNINFEGKGEAELKGHFVFKLNAHPQDNLVIRGEIKNWGESFALKHLGNGMWFLELPITTDKNEIKFKILKGDSWEKGEDRVLSLDPSQGIITLKDPEF